MIEELDELAGPVESETTGTDELDKVGLERLVIVGIRVVELPVQVDVPDG